MPPGRATRARRRGTDPQPRLRKASRSSWLTAREDFEAPLKAIGLESFFSPFVVVGIVGVYPIAFGVHGKIGDFSGLGRLDQELLFGNEAGDQLDFGFVQVKLAPVEIAVHVRVGEEDCAGAAFDVD